MQEDGAWGHAWGSDRCLPASVSSQFALFGNYAPSMDYFAAMEGTVNEIWSWFNWNRMSFVLVAGNPPQTPTGDLFIHEISEEWGADICSQWGDYQVHADGPEDEITPHFSWLHLPGWGWSACTDDPENVDCEVRILYGDFHLATGEHCRARVEIGNSVVYENCSNMAISTVDSWSDIEITATVRIGQLRAGDKFIFFVASDGVISSGYPVTLPGPGAPTELRMPEIEH